MKTMILAGFPTQAAAQAAAQAHLAGGTDALALDAAEVPMWRTLALSAPSTVRVVERDVEGAPFVCLAWQARAAAVVA